ncbi:MAG TPA: YceI family protein [Candidatus Binatia bacterium]|nr:YceI family protein [Candidatus Binatia bacterium]
MNQARHARATRRNAVLMAVVLATAGTLAAVTQAIAAPETYTIDPAHSAVGFSIRHLFSRVPGRFTKFEGKIVVDRDDFTKSSVDVSIDAASIDTNEPARDKHLKSPDFFDVAKNPKLTFKSTKVTQAGPTKLSVEGSLTIRGTTKPVTLDVDVLGFGPGYGGKVLGGFEARTKINRQDFGVAWNDLIEGGGAVLGDEVEIKINVEAAREKPAQPAASPAKKGN